MIVSSARRGNATLHINPDGTHPGSRPVMDDGVQSQLFMMNLIMNSCDAMSDMAGPRELAFNSQEDEKDQLMVFVSDTAVGLRAQPADQIFNAVFTTNPHGTALGRRINRSIVEAHGGRGWAAADNSLRGANFYSAPPNSVEAHK
jgi:signal transduction histidine kinase